MNCDNCIDLDAPVLLARSHMMVLSIVSGLRRMMDKAGLPYKPLTILGLPPRIRVQA
ncbi:MAG: hypothetical protein KIT76_08355 [Pseudolabrys sp.]|nr:hypothetical protein [Pseudolabrys sp.]